jgi:hypothetical protein
LTPFDRTECAECNGEVAIFGALLVVEILRCKVAAFQQKIQTSDNLPKRENERQTKAQRTHGSTNTTGIARAYTRCTCNLRAWRSTPSVQIPMSCVVALLINGCVCMYHCVADQRSCAMSCLIQQSISSKPQNRQPNTAASVIPVCSLRTATAGTVVSR